MAAGRRRHWGWGYEDEQASAAQLRAQAQAISSHLGFGDMELEQPVPLERATLPAIRVKPPPRLASICSADLHARASHALGKSYRDVVAGLRGRFEHAPDFVARPREERDVEAILDWCESEAVAAIPYGGGTSVVGGVEPRVPSRCEGAISIDLGDMRDVVEVDGTSRAALIQAGATGPGLEAQLASHGLTLRHFPQSFELSTLGGWVATRAAGHYATLATHIDDLVESVRAITPAGAWESRRLPGSGAGPSPDGMLVGSEGILGVITSAWVRVQARPVHRAQTAVRLPGFRRGADCVRELSQAGLNPSNCRLLDAAEAALTGAGDGTHATLMLGFESCDHPVGAAIDRALEICAAHGGRWDAVQTRGPQDGGGSSGAAVSGGSGGASPGAVSSWREAFLRAPYLRDVLVAMGVITETFETAITWDRLPRFHAAVTQAAEQAVNEVTGADCGPDRGQARVTCRFTHVYPDGPALYFTVLAPGRRGEEVDQWDAIKRAVSGVLMEQGGTITHHHAVGRDHRPWYDVQRPDAFAAALSGAKAAVDPAGIMNPGVLIGPLR